MYWFIYECVFVSKAPPSGGAWELHEWSLNRFGYVGMYALPIRQQEKGPTESRLRISWKATENWQSASWDQQFWAICICIMMTKFLKNTCITTQIHTNIQRNKYATFCNRTSVSMTIHISPPCSAQSLRC